MNNGTEFLTLEAGHPLEETLHLCFEGDVDWIQKHPLICLIVSGYMVIISEAQKIRLSKLANKVTRIVAMTPRLWFS